MMTGMPAVAASSFKSFKTSNPSSLGMTTSRRTRSSRSERARRSASSPSAAVSTSRPCWRSRASAARRRNRSSSARRTRRAPSGTVPRQQAPDELAELLERQVGLHEVAGDAEVTDLGDVLLARRVGEDQDLHGTGRLVAAQRPQHLEAGKLWHQHVQQNEIRLLAAREAEPFLAVGRGRDREPALSQAPLPPPPKNPILPHHPDPVPPWPH